MSKSGKLMLITFKREICGKWMDPRELNIIIAYCRLTQINYSSLQTELKVLDDDSINIKYATLLSVYI